MIALGQKAKDKVTGFEGIITGYAVYVYGCTQYVLTPPVVHNKIEDSQWFDEGRIEVIGKGIHATDLQAEVPGGPNRDAPKR